LKTRNAEKEISSVLRQTKPYFRETEIREAMEKVRKLEEGPANS